MVISTEFNVDHAVAYVESWAVTPLYESLKDKVDAREGWKVAQKL